MLTILFISLLKLNYVVILKNLYTYCIVYGNFLLRFFNTTCMSITSGVFVILFIVLKVGGILYDCVFKLFWEIKEPSPTEL